MKPFQTIFTIFMKICEKGKRKKQEKENYFANLKEREYS
jgi:hypothetical protein